ncbi:hypothetical protein DPMN_102827 [Dreissena polymorpha]|uniref:Uncharacterized protein n=1 Tax=Dreissena polymorpha TaxID=45954 RepID=A0A9D4H9V2_DREPO|nr:hypothetical protein DPMN_102827 [Dreissena polymorpha]
MAVVLVSILPLYYQVALVQGSKLPCCRCKGQYTFMWLLYMAVYFHKALVQGSILPLGSCEREYIITWLLHRALYYYVAA